MSGDFLSDEELAELEAELAELDDSDDEPEGASEKALEDEVKTRSEKAAPAETEEPEFELDDVELEAELNAVEAGHAGDDDDDDAAIETATKSAEADLEPELESDDVVKEAPYKAEEPVRVESLADEIEEKAKNTSVDKDEELDDMLLNASTSFNPRQLQKDLAFSENNLDDAFMGQPGLFAHYSGVAHRAARRYDQLVQQEKLVYAAIENEVRQQAASDGEKTTEPAVKSRVLLDKRHRSITSRMLDAKAVAGMTKDACESFKQRRDMLIQVGANMREEQKGDLRMRSRQESSAEKIERAMTALKPSQ